MDVQAVEQGERKIGLCSHNATGEKIDTIIHYTIAQHRTAQHSIRIDGGRCEGFFISWLTPIVTHAIIIIMIIITRSTVSNAAPSQSLLTTALGSPVDPDVKSSVKMLPRPSSTSDRSMRAC